jgi:hypothetical protein
MKRTVKAYCVQQQSSLIATPPNVDTLSFFCNPPTNMEQQQQQQQQQEIHPRILAAIDDLFTDCRNDFITIRTTQRGWDRVPIDPRSWEHLISVFGEQQQQQQQSSRANNKPVRRHLYVECLTLHRTNWIMAALVVLKFCETFFQEAMILPQH